MDGRTVRSPLDIRSVMRKFLLTWNALKLRERNSTAVLPVEVLWITGTTGPTPLPCTRTRIGHLCPHLSFMDACTNGSPKHCARFMLPKLSSLNRMCGKLPRGHVSSDLHPMIFWALRRG